MEGLDLRRRNSLSRFLLVSFNTNLWKGRGKGRACCCLLFFFFYNILSLDAYTSHLLFELLPLRAVGPVAGGRLVDTTRDLLVFSSRSTPIGRRRHRRCPRFFFMHLYRPPFPAELLPFFKWESRKKGGIRGRGWSVNYRQEGDAFLLSLQSICKNGYIKE